MVRMVNSGTEAVMSALRLARGFTGREKLIKFDGCYHGHSDCMLVKAGSGALTSGNPDSAGVTRGAAQDTLAGPIQRPGFGGTAAGEQPGPGGGGHRGTGGSQHGRGAPGSRLFARPARACAMPHGALLIFDEVITGFRLALGGAMEYFGVEADLVTYGKIIGAGMPVGAYGGRREIMAHVSPSGSVYQAGTLSGNPVAMAAGIANLTQLRDHPEIYTAINQMAEALAQGLRQALPGCTVNQVGSLVCPFFTPGPVTDFATARQSDTGRYAAYFKHMLSQGIYLAPAQFEAMFVSAAHTMADIQQTIEAASRLPQS